MTRYRSIALLLALLLTLLVASPAQAAITCSVRIFDWEPSSSSYVERFAAGDGITYLELDGWDVKFMVSGPNAPYSILNMDVSDDSQLDPQLDQLDPAWSYSWTGGGLNVTHSQEDAMDVRTTDGSSTINSIYLYVNMEQITSGVGLPDHVHGGCKKGVDVAGAPTRAYRIVNNVP